MTPLPIRRVHDVTLMASNIEVLREFYVRIGFELVFAQGEDLVVFAAGANEFALHRVATEPCPAATVSFIVDDAAEIAASFDAIGVPYEGPMPMRPGLAGLRIKDPNGNHIEFLAASAGEDGV